MKGIGEAGTIGAAPAVINAVVDALRPLGVTDVPMPAVRTTSKRSGRGRSTTPPAGGREPRAPHGADGTGVIPAAFDYVRADSVDAALASLAEHGDDAKVLAGGHSLLPLMKLRLAQPEVLIDVGRLSDLAYIRDGGDHVAIGALTRHRDVETTATCSRAAGADPRPRRRQVGDPQVRHRGTIGGSIAHADPASDLPAVLLALGASLVVRSQARGERVIAVDDFFTGFLESALEPDELLTEIRVPKVAGAGWSFQKFNRRAQDWAIVGVALRAQRRPPASAWSTWDRRRCGQAEWRRRWPTGATVADAAEHAADGAEPQADLNASVEYRTHLAKVLVRRALDEAS